MSKSIENKTLPKIVGVDLPIHLSKEESSNMINYELARARSLLTPLPGSDLKTRFVYGVKRFLNYFKRFWIDCTNSPRREKNFNTYEEYSNWRQSIIAYP